MSGWAYFEDKKQGVEFRRLGGRIEFRLIHNDNPRNYQQIVANVELRAQGGAWVPVPRHLLNDVPNFGGER